MYLRMRGEGQRVKLDPLIEFGKWVNLMENGTDKNVRMAIFDNAKELVAGQMKELVMSAASGSSCQYCTHLHQIVLQPMAPGQCCTVQDSLLDSGQR